MRTIPELEEGTHRAKASGTLPNGKSVVVNSNGTVSAISGTSISQSKGSEVSFNAGQSMGLSSAFDINSGKVVVTYKDGANSDYPTAVVGTISGGSVSFGSEVVIDTVSSGTCTVYDENANKVAVFYVNNGLKGKVGTVSGTGISFGSAGSISLSSDPTLTKRGAIFDPDTNKIVVAYKQASSSSKAVIATISGTDITFGTPAVLESSTAGREEIGLGYDTLNNKVIVAHRNPNSPYDCKVVVGTVSSNSISFGSEATFNAGNQSYPATPVFDPSSGKVVIAYRDGSNSSYGKTVLGTVSGTSITFGSPVTWHSGTTYNATSAYHADAKKVVTFFTNGSSSARGDVVVGSVSGSSITYTSGFALSPNDTNIQTLLTYDSTNKIILANYVSEDDYHGEAVVYQPAYTSTNLTAENFIGISKGGAYAAGSSATVDIIGSVSENQSSLTAGQSYFVQIDGTLGLTADDPSVFAGTAISATRLIVKT